MRLGALVLVAPLALGLSGCGGSQDDAVSDTAAEFYTAVADGDGAAACVLLAPATRSELEQSSGQSCDQAIGSEGLPTVGDPIEVAAFGTSGWVRFDGETAFLSRFTEGWRVIAAGCTARDERPHDCKITGG